MKRDAKEAFGSTIPVPTSIDAILNYRTKDWVDATRHDKKPKGHSGIIALLRTEKKKILRSLLTLEMNFQEIIHLCKTPGITPLLHTISARCEDIKALNLPSNELLKLLGTPDALKQLNARLARSVSLGTNDGALSRNDASDASPQSLIESEPAATSVTPVEDILGANGWGPRIFYRRPPSATPPIAPVKNPDFGSFPLKEDRSETPSVEKEVDITGTDVGIMLYGTSNDVDPSESTLSFDSSGDADALQAVASSPLQTDFSVKERLPPLAEGMVWCRG